MSIRLKASSGSSRIRMIRRNGLLRDRGNWHVDRGERRAGPLRDPQIVVSDHRKVSGDGDAERARGLVDAHGVQVGRGEDRCRPFRQGEQGASLDEAVSVVELAGTDELRVDRHACGVERRAVAGEAGGRCKHRLRAGDDADPAVAQIEQMPCREIPAVRSAEPIDGTSGAGAPAGSIMTSGMLRAFRRCWSLAGSTVATRMTPSGWRFSTSSTHHDSGKWSLGCAGEHHP